MSSCKGGEKITLPYCHRTLELQMNNVPNFSTLMVGKKPVLGQMDGMEYRLIAGFKRAIHRWSISEFLEHGKEKPIVKVENCAVLHHLTLMFINPYPPPGIGNSFCLVVKIRDSEPKGSRFESSCCHRVTRKNTQHPPSVHTTRWQHQKNHINSIFCYVHQMAAPQLLQQRSFPNSKSMTYFTAQRL
ncbi:hypothetical protein AVEN_199866-1 [Araneus ventricosus]|uniref:Uncharacterized protein n=1 Tax=Araneus ventricosus TaxID=182803 RepID=A0A4Y2VKJ1_ARAVE|nr:hypothetical protein AVEN_210976-1 [Araneus ventricosus]GBO24170.1 hypothetical protein AVEN_199866-1 [Araneus ventricosus]